MESEHVIVRCGQWQISPRGIEAVGGPCLYEIDKAELRYPWWSEHMSRKRWVNMADFEKALSLARHYFNTPSDGD